MCDQVYCNTRAERVGSLIPASQQGCADTHDEMLGYKYDQCSRYHIFALKKTRASGRNVSKVFQPCCETGIREPTVSDA